MQCDNCGARLRVRQTREPMTCVAGKSGRLVEEEIDRIGMSDSNYVVRDRVCDGCGTVVGTAEITLDDLRRLVRMRDLAKTA